VIDGLQVPAGGGFVPAGVVMGRPGGGGILHRDFHGIFGTVTVSFRVDAA
jgi:hypothetical protein